MSPADTANAPIVPAFHGLGLGEPLAVAAEGGLGIGDLLDAIPRDLDLVCANLPYVDASAALPPEVRAQPATALLAGAGGAQLVTRLLLAAPGHLRAGGRVLVEIDPAILEPVLSAAAGAYAEHRVHRDLGGHERVVEAWSFIPTNSEASP